MSDAQTSTHGMVAVVNAGSSSLKFSLYERAGQQGLTLVMRGLAQGLDSSPRFETKDPGGKVLASHTWEAGQAIGHDVALQYIIEAVRALLPDMQVLAVGHRVVHGGTEFSAPKVVTTQVLAQLTELIPLAPLHQPDNLAPIRLAFDLMPGVPQVACFDTAFHRSMAPLAQMFALPYEYYDEGVRRYGFHGLSYEYIASRLPDVAPKLATGRAAVMHLGNGASACGLMDGRSIASTMGFSALDGLTMGTRCGAIDPGAVLHLIQQRGMKPAEVERMLYRQSGLLGISGVSSDMRTLLESDAPRAQLAVEHFVYRIVRELGSLAFAMRGLDGLVFTGGIGEHAAPVRQRVVESLAWIGAELDNDANAASATCITTPQSRCAVYVIPTDEELMIAQHTLRALSG